MKLQKGRRKAAAVAIGSDRKDKYFQEHWEPVILREVAQLLVGQEAVTPAGDTGEQPGLVGNAEDHPPQIAARTDEHRPTRAAPSPEEHVAPSRHGRTLAAALGAAAFIVIGAALLDRALDGERESSSSVTEEEATSVNSPPTTAPEAPVPTEAPATTSATTSTTTQVTTTTHGAAAPLADQQPEPEANDVPILIHKIDPDEGCRARFGPDSFADFDVDNSNAYSNVCRVGQPRT